MKISLIHPSRGRSKKAYDTWKYWLDHSSGNHEIEYILSIDFDDPEVHDYRHRFTQHNIITGNNSNVVQATNIAAEKATGDIFIYMSDDMFPEENWDEAIINAIGERINEPVLLKVDDCLQEFWKDVVTVPVITKVLYQKLGYFFHPGYKSMFVDQDLYWVCKNRGWLLEAPHIKIDHHHYCNGKAPRDETYLRSESNWEQGKALYFKRKKLNFPIQ